MFVTRAKKKMPIKFLEHLGLSDHKLTCMLMMLNLKLMNTGNEKIETNGKYHIWLWSLLYLCNTI